MRIARKGVLLAVCTAVMCAVLLVAGCSDSSGGGGDDDTQDAEQSQSGNGERIVATSPSDFVYGQIVVGGYYSRWTTTAIIGLASHIDRNNVESIQIPDAIDGDTIHAIGESAFQYCYNLKSVKLPPSISTIDVDAFAYCTSLKEIDLSNNAGLSKIGDGAFRMCTSLKKVQFPESLTSIGDNAFRECISLSEIPFPSHLTSIGESAFANCHYLTSIDMSGTQIDTICLRAFEGCAYLQSVSLSPALQRVGYYAFRDCKNLTEVVIPPGLTKVGFDSFFSGSGTSSPDAFQGCRALPKEVLDALKAIGYK